MGLEWRRGAEASVSTGLVLELAPCVLREDGMSEKRQSPVVCDCSVCTANFPLSVEQELKS